MSPGKRRRVTFADEPSVVTFERVTDQSEVGEDGKHPAGLDCLDMRGSCLIMDCDLMIVTHRFF